MAHGEAKVMTMGSPTPDLSTAVTGARWSDAQPAYQRLSLAAQFADKSPSTLRRMEKRGLIRIVRSGGRTLVDMASLKTYLDNLPSLSQR
jgi:hypothetical protein